jgi:energy-coupling factor transporter ATP-binding protein EcfA2
MALVEITGLIGRDAELIQLNNCLEGGKHTLILAPDGYGKTTLLNYTKLLAEDVHYSHLWITAGGTAKNTITDIARAGHLAFGLMIPKSLYLELPKQTRARFQKTGRIDWKDLNRPLAQRLTLAELGDVIINSLRAAPLDRKFIFFIENLKCVPQLATFYERLFQCSQIMACLDPADQYRAHIQPLTYHFMEKIELRPLPIEACRELTEEWLKMNPIRFSGDSAQKAFVQHVARDSGGIPAAIEGMLENVKTLDEVTTNKVRELSHDAAVQYFDMTYILFGLLVGFMALRYVSRGIGEAELMMLSGVGSALMIGFFYVMRFLKSPGKNNL